MSLKLILISPEGSLVKDGKLHKPLITDLCSAVDRLAGKGARVAIWSNRAWTVNQTKPLHEYLSERTLQPVEAVGVAHGDFPARSRAGSVDPILTKYAVTRSETILVGTNDEDLRAGVNNKLLLVRPDWYGANSEYGFSVKSIAELERFCTIFGFRQHPIYWSITDGPLRMDAMGPYSTKIQAYAGFGIDALHAAKYEQGSLEFWHRLVVSSLYFSGLIANVDYIASYPGHSVGLPTRAIDEVMIALGKCFRKPFFTDLIVRHTQAMKSAYTATGAKTFQNQVNTIRLNSYPHPYGGPERRKSPIGLKGKTVLVVDDICTHGRSLDTARRYIEAAGGKALLFSWLKTINTSFLAMDPSPKLKPFQINNLAAEPGAVPYAYNDCIIADEAPAEIASLLDQYKSWKV